MEMSESEILESEILKLRSCESQNQRSGPNTTSEVSPTRVVVTPRHGVVQRVHHSAQHSTAGQYSVRALGSVVQCAAHNTSTQHHNMNHGVGDITPNPKSWNSMKSLNPEIS